MKRHILNAEITRLESNGPDLVERFGKHSKEYTARTERLKALKIERMRRDFNYRKTNKFRKAA
jgi:hypothetical protein